MSYGRDLPATARLAPMLWLLHVSDLAHGCPLASRTPHCRSTSTGPDDGVNTVSLERNSGGLYLLVWGLWP